MNESETDASATARAQPAQPVAAPAPGQQASSLADRAGDFVEASRARLLAIRHSVLKHTPAFVINNASNFISAVHLVAETWMLKSNNVQFMVNNRPGGGPVHPVIDPLNNLKRAVTGQDHLDRLGGVKQNQWGALSTTTGLANWTLGLAVPEGRDDQKQINDMVRLRHEHPVKYFLKRTVEGFYWFHPQYKRQQIGLGVTFTGLCSFLSGFNNVNTRAHTRFSNVPHSIGGLLTMAAGLQLWYATDREQAWSRYGGTMSLRTLLVPWTVMEKRGHFDGNWGYYAAGATALQTSAIMSYFIGGAEKRPDGTIVDHKSEYEAANKKYGRHHHHHRHDAPPGAETPTATVSQVAGHDAGIAGAVSENAVRLS
ncbi:MAG: hypothetical protein WDN72_04490 [Alphaproteobacteria bacterium]